MTQTKLRADQTFQAPAFKNLVFDGEMRISQAGASETGITASKYPKAVDLWYLYLNTLGTWSASKDSTIAPKLEGFGDSYKLECTTANASPATGAYAILTNRNMPGRTLQRLKKGTANAESLTLSFWVRASKTGNFVVELQDVDNNRHICSLQTINSVDTWEKKTVTFPGDTTGALDNDNGLSFQVNFWLGAGTTFTSGTLATSWASTVNANRAVGTMNLADTVSNTFYLTGVQLEIGTEATEFEHLSWDTVLKQVSHYYQKSYAYGDAPGTASRWTAYAVADDTSNLHFYAPQLPERMRAAPVVKVYAYDGTADKVSTVGGTTISTGTNTVGGIIDTNYGMYINNTSAPYTAAARYIFNWVADARL